MQAFKNDLIEEYLKKILRVYSKITPVIPSDRIMSNLFFFWRRGGPYLSTFRFLDVTHKENE